MRSYPALKRLKIGCVRYLNAKPLIFAYPGKVAFDHPSKLATRLARGSLDVALVPTYELLRAPDYKIVDGVSIASRGPVFSVFLAYKGRLRGQKTIALDPGSLTSVYLLRTILAEFHGMRPRFAADAGENTARLVIGNQAIAFRRKHGEAFNYLDLGEEWTKRTGLPFVYAMWLARPEIPNPEPAAEELRVLKKIGTARIAEIIHAGSRSFDPDFSRRYLGGHIRYALGPEEKRGIKKWRELLLKHGLIESADKRLQFV